jgi:hypothetical protein
MLGLVPQPNLRLALCIRYQNSFLEFFNRHTTHVQMQRVVFGRNLFKKEQIMKIFITGGTGFVGSTLVKTFIKSGYEVAVLSRRKNAILHKGASIVEGNPMKKGAWQEQASQCDLIVNLAGESIFGRWTETKKKSIKESRILTTQNVVEAIGLAKQNPPSLFNASAVGYYGVSQDKEFDEESPVGSDFLALIAQQWESEALKAEAYGSRVVLCRFGVVLGRNGGMLKQILPLYKAMLGSPLGSGQQWLPWIHERDLAYIFLFLIEHQTITGPVNCVSPTPVTNKKMSNTLYKVLGRPALLPHVPAFIIKVAMGEFGDFILKGQRALPKRLFAEGFNFKFPSLQEALEDLTR